MSGRRLDYWEIVDRRRELQPVGRERDHYKTLTEAGLDGSWVTPIQMTSDSPCGPVLLANNFLDWPTIEERRAEILRYGGYLPDIDFNRILDLALWQAGMHRRDIYITQVLHLLPITRSGGGQHRPLLQRSFETVTQHELRCRLVIVLGKQAAKRCERWRKENENPFEVVAELDHPSDPANSDSWQQQANALARALFEATDRKHREREEHRTECASIWQVQVRGSGRRDWPTRPARGKR